MTFSHKPYVLPMKTLLTDKIKAHGGYTTNITRTLQNFNDKLIELK